MPQIEPVVESFSVQVLDKGRKKLEINVVDLQNFESGCHEAFGRKQAFQSWGLCHYDKAVSLNFAFVSFQDKFDICISLCIEQMRQAFLPWTNWFPNGFPVTIDLNVHFHHQSNVLEILSFAELVPTIVVVFIGVANVPIFPFLLKKSDYSSS